MSRPGATTPITAAALLLAGFGAGGCGVGAPPGASSPPAAVATTSSLPPELPTTTYPPGVDATFCRALAKRIEGYSALSAAVAWSSRSSPAKASLQAESASYQVLAEASPGPIKGQVSDIATILAKVAAGAGSANLGQLQSVAAEIGRLAPDEEALVVYSASHCPGP